MFSAITGKVIQLQNKTVSSFSSSSSASYTPATSYSQASFSSYNDVSYDEQSYHRIFIETKDGEKAVTIPDSLDVREGHQLTVLFDSDEPIWAINENLKTRAFCFRGDNEGDDSFWRNIKPNKLESFGAVFEMGMLQAAMLVILSLAFIFLGGAWYMMWVPIAPALFYKWVKKKGLLGVARMPIFNEQLAQIANKWRYKVVNRNTIPLVIFGSLCFLLVWGNLSNKGLFVYDEEFPGGFGLLIGGFAYVIVGIPIVLPLTQYLVSRLQPEFDSDVKKYRDEFIRESENYLSSEEYLAQVNTAYASKSEAS